MYPFPASDAGILVPPVASKGTVRSVLTGLLIAVGPTASLSLKDCINFPTEIDWVDLNGAINQASLSPVIKKLIVDVPAPT